LKTGGGGAQEDGRTVEAVRRLPFIIDVDIRLDDMPPIDVCDELNEPFMPVLVGGLEAG